MTHVMTLRIPDALYEQVRQEAFDQRETLTDIILNALVARPRTASGCDICGKPPTHVTTPGGFRGCDEHFLSAALSSESEDKNNA